MLTLSKLFFILVAITSCNALNCFNCIHMEADDVDFDEDADFRFDKSCRAGKSPNTDFIKACEDLNYLELGHQTQSPDSNGLPLLQEDENSTSVNYYCLKLTFEGQVEGIGKKAKGTVRTCISSMDMLTKPDICHYDRNSLFSRIDDKALIQSMSNYTSLFSSETTIGVCICDKDDCNGASHYGIAPVSYLSVILLGTLLRWSTL